MISLLPLSLLIPESGSDLRPFLAKHRRRGRWRAAGVFNELPWLIPATVLLWIAGQRWPGALLVFRVAFVSTPVILHRQGKCDSDINGGITVWLENDNRPSPRERGGPIHTGPISVERTTYRRPPCFACLWPP